MSRVAGRPGAVGALQLINERAPLGLCRLRRMCGRATPGRIVPPPHVCGTGGGCRCVAIVGPSARLRLGRESRTRAAPFGGDGARATDPNDAGADVTATATDAPQAGPRRCRATGNGCHGPNHRPAAITVESVPAMATHPMAS